MEGKNFYGISTSEFSCDIYSPVPLMEGERVVFGGYQLPDFYIATQDYSGGVAHIVAYDLCKNLDIPFDYTDFPQYDDEGHGRMYATALIVSAIAHQCGFSSGEYSGRRLEMGFLNYAGKTCRDILQDLSYVDVGHWQDGGGVLMFVPFTAPTAGLAVPDEDSRMEIVRRGTKHISGVYAVDEQHGTTYSTGAAWRNTERLSGEYLSESMVQQSLSQIIGSSGVYAYHGWECDTMLTDYLYNIGDYLSYDGDNLPVTSCVFSFGALGITAAVSAPAADSSFTEYYDLYSREIAARVEKNAYYRNVRISSHNGMELTDGDESYGFDVSGGGVTKYAGAMLDNVMPAQISAPTKEGSRTTQTVTYGGKTYTLSYDTDETGAKTNIVFDETVQEETV